jgi:hypothetical protein
MKILFSLIVSLLLVGCGQEHSHQTESMPETPIGVPMVMSDVDLQVCLQTNRFTVNGCAVFSNAKYWVPEESWAKEKLPAILLNNQVKVGMTKAVNEANDCDTFSKVGASAARIWHANNNWATLPGTTIAVGEYYYTKWPGVRHAVVAVLTRTAKGKYTLVFIEPQGCKVIEPSREELDTCTNYLF